MKSLFNRLMSAFFEEILTNWRLALLGLTGLALSVASGWTTWDGMNNFTGNAVLSLLITFGIQGVMLIAAWLIGETFALGLQSHGDGHSGGVFWGLFLVLSVAVIAVLLALMAGSDPSEFGRDLFDFGQGWSRLLIGGVLAAVIIGAVIYGLTQRELIGPYLRGSKVILQNLPIWLMFLACMGTSVFFSFDSLFSTIFPEGERKRAGDIRAQSRISGVLADVEARLKERQRQARANLFKSEAWAKYDAALDVVQREARRAPDLINAERKRRIASSQMEAQRFREQKSTAEGRYRNLKAEKDRRLEVIDRFEKLRPPVVAEVDKLEFDLQAKRKVLLEARATAMAEARGVGNSQRTGRGPKYRELQKVVTKLTIEEDLISDQLKGAKANLDKLDQQIGTARREVEAFETQIATYGSQAEAARRMLQAGEGERAGQAQVVGTFSGDEFERSKSLFRQSPTKVNFAKLQGQCSSIYGALISVPQLKKNIEGIDCEPKDTNALAGQIFVLNKTIGGYDASCGKSAAAKFGNVDALIQHGQQCLLLSGLSGADSSDFRSEFNRIELNRDDKAHRFVVTWNAFLDGNRLAYLALAIAIAVDGLVFMSGMFGANALKSPLSEGSGAKGRTAAQLDDLMESALSPDKLRSADVVLAALRPCNREGFSQKVDMSTLDSEGVRIVQNIINVGSVIGLVEEDEGDGDVYYIRRQLYEKLSHIRQKEIKLSKVETVDRGLRQALERALLPEDQMVSNISLVMKFMHPSDAREGFDIEVDLTEARGDVLERVKRVLTAGASFGVVKPHPDIGKFGYLIKKAFHEHLDEIRETRIKSDPNVGVDDKMDFGRPIRVGKLELDKTRVSHQLDERKMRLIPPPRKSSVPSIGMRTDMDQFDSDDGLNQDSLPANSVSDYFARRLGLEHEEMEVLVEGDFGGLAKDLDKVLALVGRSHGLISGSVEGTKAELRAKISDCRRELVEKYSGLENMRREISELAELLTDVNTLFVLRTGGAYEQAIAFYVSQYVEEVNEGKANAEDRLVLFEAHAHELLNIRRDFSVDADWAEMEKSLNEFYRKLDRSISGPDYQSSEYPLN